MHVAAADDGNCCCSMIIIDCNYLAKFCCFPILLFICFHHFIPLSNYLMFQSLIGELVEFSTCQPVICQPVTCQPVNLVTCQPGTCKPFKPVNLSTCVLHLPTPISLFLGPPQDELHLESQEVIQTSLCKDEVEPGKLEHF